VALSPAAERACNDEHGRLYVPLPPAALTARSARFEKGVAGSALGGHGSVTGVKFHVFDDDDEERNKALLVQT